MNVRDATKLAAHVANGKVGLPILASLRIDHGRVMATDLVQQIEIPIEIPGDAAGAAFCVHAARLSKILKALPEDLELDFAFRDKQLILTAGDTRFDLNTLPSEDFPVLAEDDAEAVHFGLPAKVFIEALQFVRPAMGVKDIRYYLNGVHLETGAGALTLTATDGNRLHRARVPLEEHPDVTAAQGIVPDTAVEALLEIAARHTNVAIALSSTRLVVEDSETLCMRLIEGKYPDANRVIPSSRQVTGSLPRAKAIAAIERVAAILSGKSTTVSFTFPANASPINLEALTADAERARTSIAWAEAGQLVDGTTWPFVVNFKWTQLTDALRAFTGENVFLHLPENAEGSLYITDDSSGENGRREVVVMPMRA